ncbi:blue copper protein-like, partial [Hibiscus syriacus]|uniref:blue copper protein-like n=1 Tax=Hibiscus syriacus TaxID=106335 RepID=UPI0019203F60
SATNYTSWAANQTFSLGDYLIFRTSANQTVIQTYNETTYRNCTTDDALDTDTFQYNGGNSDFDQAMTIEGANYYFADGDDGVQCQHEMEFEILVRHGIGLLPSLNQPPPPPPPPYVEAPSDPAQSPPVTINGGTPSLNNNAATGGTDTGAILYSVFFGVTSLMIAFMR